MRPAPAPSRVIALNSRVIITKYGKSAVNQTIWKWKICSSLLDLSQLLSASEIAVQNIVLAGMFIAVGKYKCRLDQKMYNL